MNNLESSSDLTSSDSPSIQDFHLSDAPESLATAIFHSLTIDANVKASLQSKLSQLPISSLAYLGDAVYELYIRTTYVLPPKRSHLYHQQVVAQVRAEQQAYHLQHITTLLTEDEKQLLKRGRNASSSKPKRVEPEVYQQATSLESLVGYLYLTDPQRLAWLMNQLCLDPAQT